MTRLEQFRGSRFGQGRFRTRGFRGLRPAPGGGAAGTLTLLDLIYDRNAAGIAPSLTIEASRFGDTTPDYTFWGVFAATAQTEGQIDASPNKFSLTASTLAGLNDAAVDIDNSVTDGVISGYLIDSAGIKSAVFSRSGVTYDHVPTAFSAAEVGTVGSTIVAVALTKAAYGSSTASDWTVQVNGSSVAISSVSFTPGEASVEITLASAVVNGQTVTVAYSGSDLVNFDAEAMAAFTAQSVTNNVAVAGTTPEFHALGAAGSGSSVEWPAHASGDIGILVVSRSDGRTPVPSTPSGWTLVGNYSSGSAGNPDQVTEIYTKTATSSSEPAAVTGGTGGHQIIVIRGGSSVSVLSSTVAGSSDGGSVSLDGGAVPDNTLLIAAIGTNVNGNAGVDQITSWSNPDVAFTDRGGSIYVNFSIENTIEFGTAPVDTGATVGATTATANGSITTYAGALLMVIA